jgi:hypothetical protein
MRLISASAESSDARASILALLTSRVNSSQNSLNSSGSITVSPDRIEEKVSPKKRTQDNPDGAEIRYPPTRAIRAFSPPKAAVSTWFS